MPLTPKQQRVFNFIRGYIQSNGSAPTIQEIGRHFQMTSTASVHAVLVILEHEGLIKKTANISRGIQLVQKGLTVERSGTAGMERGL